MQKLLLLLVFISSISNAQNFSHADTIRGAMRPERACFDVTHYDLSVFINPNDSGIVGTVKTQFKWLGGAETIQMDLFNHYEIIGIYFQHGPHQHPVTDYKKDANALFIPVPVLVQDEGKGELVIQYKGKPPVAERAPWDGGFVWEKDSLGRDFVGVACEGFGASSWWPCKDHLSDEPDSMDITISTTNSLTVVSNGQLVGKVADKWGVNTFSYKVTYPINTYNVTFYAGNLVQIDSFYVSGKDTLKTEFWALDYNEAKAKKQFEQVNPMLRVYEDLFGRFPFWNDGYRLVEAPYLGMEHQSAIAYGNGYLNGYRGHQIKEVDFDYIIIHESGHEYLGNAVSVSDMADLWIHEGFCTYTEALYVEKLYGYDTMIQYLMHQRRRIHNDTPMLGVEGVNKEGSGDMYNKGAWMLHSVRTLVANDSLFFKTIKAFYQTYKYKNINTQEVCSFFGAHLGLGVQAMMEDFLTSNQIPELVYLIKKETDKKVVLEYRIKRSYFSEKQPFYVLGKKQYRILPSEKWKKKSFKKDGSGNWTFDLRFLLFGLKRLETK